MHRRRFIITAASAAAGAVFSARAAPDQHFDIVYPQIRPGRDVHAAFALATLDVAMKAANASYTTRQIEVVMERSRALAELASGNTINLHWTSMEAQAERGLNVVHIPIHRGLIGYRVFLIRQDRQVDFDRIETLEDLRSMTGVQGLGWIDARIMRDAGLRVQTPSTYETIFKMLEGRRVDYFPRGVIEAYPELESRRATEPDLAVEQSLLLAYRSDFLFYVSPNHGELAATIARGFTTAWRDGSYLKLFNTHPYIQNGLKRGNLAGRKVIRLDNPFMSDEDRAIPDTYWMHL
ncbi:hypothetical protein GCT13_36610 [Paraburkholderia sp. CNPSo 3157]|uniref:Amino acid ABC transporter substrate-binding protein n=1 Tax=Paraburkholderia franconis TaxID=2654983 RepID=A0A7X1NIM5_9BURK|nr:hypothetical protein [Paraburkholderia franconis]MPW22208.1 hypothetical protein [Paraburkholderia franconis]